MNDHVSQVMIIGASLAGTSAALGLAERGIAVALLDRCTFPRHKACGEGLSRMALTLLEKRGIPRDALLAQSQPFRGYHLINGRTDVRLNMISPFIRGVGISRATLDTKLAESADRHPLITARYGEQITDIVRTGSLWTLRTANETYSAPYMILAHGIHSGKTQMKSVRHLRQGNGRTGYSLQAQIISGTKLDETVSVVTFSEGELYLTLLSPQHLNIALVGSSRFVQKYRSTQILKEELQRRFNLMVEISWKGAGETHFGRRNHSLVPSLFLTGDSSESFDPACGLGMTHALLTSALSVDLLEQVVLGTIDSSTAQKLYRQVQTKISRRIRIHSFFIRSFFRIFASCPALPICFGGRFLIWMTEQMEVLFDPELPLREFQTRKVSTSAACLKKMRRSPSSH